VVDVDEFGTYPEEQARFLAVDRNLRAEQLAGRSPQRVAVTSTFTRPAREKPHTDHRSLRTVALCWPT
jgi:hypothetical protein